MIRPQGLLAKCSATDSHAAISLWPILTDKSTAATYPYECPRNTWSKNGVTHYVPACSAANLTKLIVKTIAAICQWFQALVRIANPARYTWHSVHK